MYSIASKAQDNYKILDSLSANLISNIRLHEKEKTFLITDKRIYASGDNIWYRGFLLKSVSEKVSTKSKNVFVELVDEKDSIISRQLLNARMQQLNGRIHLSTSLNSGYYWLRVFTGEMAMYNPTNSNTTCLYIVNPATGNSSTTDKKVAKGGAVNMQFFPEGGSIISGSNAVVGFRITDANGNPVQISGVIKNNKDTVNTPFYSDQFGLGRFEFFPSRFKKYTAFIGAKGKESLFNLPSFNLYAGQIEVAQEAGVLKKLQVLLEDSIYQKNFATFLVGVTKDSITFASVGHGMYELPFTPHSFPNGITTFYLFDKNMKLLSERSVYIDEPLIHVTAAVDKSSYPKRSKGMLSISIADVNNVPLPSSIAVSITDSAVALPNSNKKLIEEFFANTSKALSNWDLADAGMIAPSDMDVMMLSLQKGIKSQQEDAAKNYDYGIDERFLNIKGKVVNTNPADKIVTLISTSGTIIISTDTSRADGAFVIPAKDYSDSTDFTVQVKALHGKRTDDKVIINPTQFPVLTRRLPLQETLELTDDAKSAALRFYSDVLNSDPLTPSKKTDAAPANYDVSKRISRNSKIITAQMMELNGIKSVETAVLTLPGVQEINGYVTIMGLSGRAPSGTSEPMIIMNGVQIDASSLGAVPGIGSPVLSFLKNIDYRDVDFIEVLAGSEGSAYGLRGANGVILVNTKNSTSAAYVRPIKSFIADGYYIAPLYPVPDYSVSSIRESTVRDNRTTLYFNGNIITDNTGNIKVPFYTSDITGIFKVVIRGVSVHGDLVNKTLYFRTN